MLIETRAQSAAPPSTQDRLPPHRALGRPRRGRRVLDRGFAVFCAVAASLSVIVLVILLGQIAWQGRTHLDWSFLTQLASADPYEAGLRTALVGTLLIAIVCGLTAVPIGIATAVLLEEYKPRGRWLRRLHHFVQLNISNLAGVPSVVYGLLGLTVFVHLFGLFGSTGAPAFEIGIRYFDRYTTAGGRTLLVPVAGRDAPPTSPAQVRQFLDDQENPTTVQILTPERAAQHRQVAQSAAEALIESIRSELAKVARADDREAIGSILDRAWAAGGLKASLPPIRERLIDDLARSAESAPGSRRQRKALESAAERIGHAELRARFPDTLDAAAIPGRQPRTRPWYLRLPLGRSVLAGGLTLMLVVLPIIIVACQEALRAVPGSLRQASLALGATRWQTIRRTTLPAALPGLMTGIILAMSRAIGEAAPILMIAGAVYISYTPSNLMDGFTAMPLQIYAWVGQPKDEFRDLAATGILVLLGVLLLFNGLAIYLRQKTHRLS